MSLTLLATTRQYFNCKYFFQMYFIHKIISNNNFNLCHILIKQYLEYVDDADDRFSEYQTQKLCKTRKIHKET